MLLINPMWGYLMIKGCRKAIFQNWVHVMLSVDKISFKLHHLITSTISDIISLQFNVFLWKCNLPQVKQYLISYMVNSVYDFTDKLLDHLKLRAFGN